MTWDFLSGASRVGCAAVKETRIDGIGHEELRIPAQFNITRHDRDEIRTICKLIDEKRGGLQTRPFDFQLFF
jgi:hypothetical protein